MSNALRSNRNLARFRLRVTAAYRGGHFIGGLMLLFFPWFGYVVMTGMPASRMAAWNTWFLTSVLVIGGLLAAWNFLLAFSGCEITVFDGIVRKRRHVRALTLVRRGMPVDRLWLIVRETGSGRNFHVTQELIVGYQSRRRVLLQKHDCPDLAEVARFVASHTGAELVDERAEPAYKGRRAMPGRPR